MALEATAIRLLVTLVALSVRASEGAPEQSEGAGTALGACARTFLSDLYQYCAAKGNYHVADRRGWSGNGVDMFWRERRVFGGNLDRFWREKESDAGDSVHVSRSSVLLDNKLSSCLASLVKTHNVATPYSYNHGMATGNMADKKNTVRMLAPEDEAVLAEIYSDAGSEVSMLVRLCCQGSCPGYVLNALSEV